MTRGEENGKREQIYNFCCDIHSCRLKVTMMSKNYIHLAKPFSL